MRNCLWSMETDAFSFSRIKSTACEKNSSESSAAPPTLPAAVIWSMVSLCIIGLAALFQKIDNSFDLLICYECALQTGRLALSRRIEQHIALPQQLFCPTISRIVLESMPEDTANASLEGIFALITPVMTSTEGRCVAIIRCIPAARAICARRQIASSTSPALPH